MNLFQVVRVLWMRWRLIAGIAGACFLAAVIASVFLPKRYAAQTSVLLNVIKPDPVTNDLLNSSFARAFAATQAQLIDDYGVASRAVHNMGWDSDPDLKQEYLSQRKPGDGDFLHWLASQVISGTSANLVEDTNILSINYVSDTPEHARTVADALRTAYIQQSVAQRREDAARNAQWFTTQADQIRNNLTDLQKQKSDFERANNIVLQDDLSDPESERLKALASTAPAATAAPGASPAAAQLAQVDAQIVAEGSVLGPNHPELLALKQQRTALAAQAARERSAMTASGPSMSSQVAQTQSRVLAQSSKIGQLRQLAARISVLSDLYQKTVARAADLKQQADAQESGVTSMGPATAPDTPTSPRYSLILGGALVGGIVLGVMVALLLELLNRRVRSGDDLATTEVPLLGIITGDRRRSALPA